MLNSVKLGRVSEEKELMAYRNRNMLINLLAYIQLGAKRIEIRNDFDKKISEFWIEVIDQDLIKVNNLPYYLINGFYYDMINKELVVTNNYENVINDFQNSIYTASFENNNLIIDVNYQKEKKNNTNFLLAENKKLKEELNVLKEQLKTLREENKILKNNNIRYLSALNEMADTLIGLNQVQ